MRDIVATFGYDARGQVVCQTVPYDKPMYQWIPPTPSSPYWEDSCTDYDHVASEYDALGRPTVTVAPDGTRTEQRYGLAGDLVYHDILDGNRHRQQRRTDVLGRLVEVYEIEGNCGPYWGYDCGGAYNEPWAVYALTRYEYDALDNLRRVLDAEDNETLIDYDPLGRKTSMSDPNMGTWSYSYDPAANLVGQTDAKGETLTFGYDDLNRLKTKEHGSQLLAAYTYDQGTNGAGRLSQLVTVFDVVAGNVYTHTWEYDPRGRVTSETRDIDGAGIYSMAYTYDHLDRPVSLTYPSGEVVTTTYNHQGLPVALTDKDGFGYVLDAGYNVRGQMTGLFLGNGRTTSYDYDPLHFRLAGFTTDGDLQAFAYAYDPVGNVTAIADVINSNQAQTFSYDALNRLLTAQSNNQGDGQYEQSYAYDAIGNMTRMAHLTYTYGDEQPQAVLAAYQENGSQPAQIMVTAAGSVSMPDPPPQLSVRVNGVVVGSVLLMGGAFDDHLFTAQLSGNDVIEIVGSWSDPAADIAVASVTINGGTPILPTAGQMVFDAGSGAAAFDGKDVSPGREQFGEPGALRFVLGNAKAFGYDANGNMTYRMENGAVYFQEWDVENRLRVVTDSVSGRVTSFGYDASGQRLVTETAAGATYFPFPDYEVRGSGTNAGARTQYSLGGRLVAQRSGGQPLFSDNFDEGNADGWQERSGQWDVVPFGDGYGYRGSYTGQQPVADTTYAISQTQTLTYSLTVYYDSPKVDTVFRVFADFEGNPPLGRAVTIRQTNTKLLIAETANGIWSEEPELLVDVPLPAAQGETHSYQVVYDPAAGTVNVWRNGVWAVGWTFDNPLTEGSYIVLRTRANSAAIFDDVVVSDGHGESVIFFHNDHLGSVSLLSDEQGNLIADSLARYLPFGEWRTEPTTSDPSGSPLTDFGFTGQKHNMDIGLYYYNARFYAPAVGRFISADVIVPDPTNPQQFNRYSYVLNNALRYTDPSGRYCYDPTYGDAAGQCYSDDGNLLNTINASTSPLSPVTLIQHTPTAEDYLDWTNESIAYARSVLGENMAPDELIAYLLFAEASVAPGNAFVIEAMTRRYNHFCGGGAWSHGCISGFWNYYSPMHNLFNSPSMLQPQFTNQSLWRGNIGDANQVSGRPELGGRQQDRPWGWATIDDVNNRQTYNRLANGGITEGAGGNQAFFTFQYEQMGINKLFLVLSPDQQAVHCGGRNCTTTP